MIEAEIAARHARAETWADTDWNEIDQLYAALVDLTANPIAVLNWAIARSYTQGPEAAFPLLDTLQDHIGDYHLLAATRADLHRRAGNQKQAQQLYRQLVASAPSQAQRAYYKRRLTDSHAPEDETDRSP